MTTLMPILRRGGLFNYPFNTTFDKFFSEFSQPRTASETTDWVPTLDVTENEKEFHVRVEVPGIDKKDIDITVADGLLTIKGEKEKDFEEKDAQFHRVESVYGSFHRTLRRGDTVEAEKIDASYKDGILKITIPKAEENEPKKIEVH